MRHRRGMKMMKIRVRSKTKREMVMVMRAKNLKTDRLMRAAKMIKRKAL